MNRIRIRLTAWLLAASMILASAPANAHAEDLHKIENVTRPSASNGQWVNPQYENLLSAPQQSVQLRENAPVVTVGDVQHTLQDAADELRQGMVDRLDSIAVTFSVDADFDATDIWDEALKHTGNPKEGDYLLGQLHNYGFSAYYNELKGQGYFTYVFKPGYFTTADQEQQMDDAVDALLLELALDDATEYEKVKGIYDWICANVTYDYDNLNDKNYYLKHSAYAAMINGTAVCQGFAVLFYRLALELGVDCRYITGTGNGGAHAWNIVRLGSLYYHVDATWDQPLFQYGMDYEYFLRCGANFLDHTRNEEYASGDFHQQYPMSPEDYGVDITWPVSGTCGENLTWVLEADGTLTISGTGNMDDFYSEDPQWQQYSYHIRKIVIGPDVQSVGAFAFYYCASLTHVEIHGSTVIGESAFSYCFSLEQIQMPNVLAIGDAVFYGCNSLRTVHLPASLQVLGNEVFYDCILLQSITVDPANPYYTAKDHVLFNKDMTYLYLAASMIGQLYVIPEGVTQIAPYAFRCNSQLQIISVPSTVTELPEGAFYGCAVLRNVSFAGNLQQIGPFAFYGCSSMEQIQLPASLQTISDYAFGNSGLLEITIPAGVMQIGYGAFDHSALTEVTFLGPAPFIDDDAFGNVFADVYYPSVDCDPTWENMIDDYGGYLQWYPTDRHSYHAVVTPADCVNGGYTTYTCGCGHSYVADQTEPAGHNWDDGVVTQEPTDTVAGVRTYTCIACAATRQEEIPPKAHEHQFAATVTPPTCTQDGYTTYSCACGESYKEDIVSATGHSYASVVTPPACETEGYTTHTCTVCGDSYRDNEVAATGHSMGDWVQTKAPECEVPGEETSRCSACAHMEHRPVDAFQHSFTNYISDQNATCTADGTKTAACDHDCGKTDTVADTGSMIPHEMGQWETVTEATEETEGLKRRTCLHCSHSEEQTIPVLAPVGDITSDVYHINGDYIGNITAGLTVSQFLEGIHEAEYIQVMLADQVVTSDSLIATGMELHLVVREQTVRKLTIVVTGDINGDGSISLSDMLMVKSHILGKTNLAGAAALAADTNNDQGISITDFLQIKAHILGKNNIQPHG